ncbi:hypothetical protein DXG03_009555 [Asterophora parasitica]|uniref:Uncharacterized protein n=1 Tax=Asterophora parasitica TaxID=117018 RepID=A0A9P7FXB4_9AGAR|nr:hypothetical protein DXG03_009555 [Asterophora parasitica]
MRSRNLQIPTRTLPRQVLRTDVLSNPGTRHGGSASAEQAFDWNIEREWFDERARATKRHELDDRRLWTGGPNSADGDDEDLSNSYYYDDFSMWPYRQQERDESLTLPE